MLDDFGTCAKHGNSCNSHGFPMFSLCLEQCPGSQGNNLLYTRKTVTTVADCRKEVEVGQWLGNPPYQMEVS